MFSMKKYIYMPTFMVLGQTVSKSIKQSNMQIYIYIEREILVNFFFFVINRLFILSWSLAQGCNLSIHMFQFVICNLLIVPQSKIVLINLIYLFVFILHFSSGSKLKLESPNPISFSFLKYMYFADLTCALIYC